MIPVVKIRHVVCGGRSENEYAGNGHGNKRIGDLALEESSMIRSLLKKKLLRKGLRD